MYLEDTVKTTCKVQTEHQKGEKWRFKCLWTLNCCCRQTCLSEYFGTADLLRTGNWGYDSRGQQKTEKNVVWSQFLFLFKWSGQKLAQITSKRGPILPCIKGSGCWWCNGFCCYTLGPLVSNDHHLNPTVYPFSPQRTNFHFILPVPCHEAQIIKNWFVQPILSKHMNNHQISIK